MPARVSVILSEAEGQLWHLIRYSVAFSMTRDTVGNTRLLFVIDNDFGELHMSMLLVEGRPLAAHSTFLLPPRLFKLNHATMPVATRGYENAADLLAIIEAVQPDVVFLCSAYLLPFHHLMSIAELQR